MSMTKIAQIDVGVGGQASIDFTNIPQTYTDLMITLSGRSTLNPVSGGISVRVRFNGTTTGYTSKSLYGQGSGSAGSYSPAGWGGSVASSDSTANTFGNTTIYIPNYAGANNKSYSAESVTENNATQAFQEFDASLWTSTAAITQVTLSVESGSFVQYSTATLYGVNKVPSQGITPKATGGDIYQNGAYTYHVFNASGTFTPTTTIPNAEVLVVAGGGGGGWNWGGGGGAGGLQAFTGQTISGAQTVTVGGGGAGSATGSTSTGTSGTSTTFGSLTTSVGGGGGGSNDANGLAGGSGGGGGAFDGTKTHTGGAGTSGQGYAGGQSTGNAQGAGGQGGGGGGGAAAVGVNASSSNAGAGGSGSLLYSVWAGATSTGVSGYYAGGGGGGAYSGFSINAGAGGAGGGGTGGYTPSANGGTGTVNTGGGGGGNAGGGSGSGGAGGSGIVIIRYA